jgi:enoyl reductase-like protein
VGEEIRTTIGTHQVRRDVTLCFCFYNDVEPVSDGIVHLDTPFSRLLGKLPIMVAGMTPTTVKGGFVSAILDAGFHVELAGGGHYNAAALREKVAEIQTKIPAGVGITLNSLYINPRQFGFQLPLWQQM